MKQFTQTILLASVLTTGACSAFAQSSSSSGMDDGHSSHEGFGPSFAVVNDLEHLQRLYDLSGRESEMRALGLEPKTYGLKVKGNALLGYSPRSERRKTPGFIGFQHSVPGVSEA